MKVEKVTTDCLKVKNHRTGPNLLVLQVVPSVTRFFCIFFMNRTPPSLLTG